MENTVISTNLVKIKKIPFMTAYGSSMIIFLLLAHKIFFEILFRIQRKVKPTLANCYKIGEIVML